MKRYDAKLHLLDDIPYQALVEQSLVGIYLIQDGVLKYCNEAFAEITGHTSEQLIDQPINQVVAPDSLDTVEHNIQQRLRGGPGSSARYFHQAVHKEGHIVDLEVHGHTIEHEGRPAIAGVAINMTKQLSYERDLRHKNQQLKNMSRHINRLRENRRQEMARDIHDILGGLLTSIKMGATRLLRRNSSTEANEIATDIIDLSQECIDFARNQSEQLYPATLNYLGLKPTLENLLKQLEKRSSLVCTLSIHTEVSELSPPVALIIFRTVQESLTNIVRHAKASEVNVTLLQQQQNLLVHIDDNGIGLNAADSREGACGLLFMRERAAEVGGEIITTKSPSGGTRITLIIDDLKATNIAPNPESI